MKIYKEPLILGISIVLSIFFIISAVFNINNDVNKATVDNKIPLPVEIGDSSSERTSTEANNQTPETTTSTESTEASDLDLSSVPSLNSGTNDNKSITDRFTKDPLQGGNNQ